MTFVGCLVLVGSLSGCKTEPTLDGPCDSAQMKNVRDAVAGADASSRAMLVAAGLGEACQSKLPSGIGETLRKINTFNTADRATLFAGALEENSRFANAACPNWQDTAAKALQNAPPKRAAALYQGCGYARLDVLTQAEFEKSWSMSGFALMALPLYSWLVDKGMQPAEAKRLMRDMALSEEPDEPSPVVPATP